MDSKADKRKIAEFWDWFSKNCGSFGIDFNNTELLKELDRWITSLGNFSWEIGPGTDKENALVISPGGDLALLNETKRIVGEAIKSDSWEFYYAKQPKQWELKFDFETRDNAIVEVDGSRWEYVLLRYDDGMFEIIIKAPLLNQLDQSDKNAAAEILLDGIIGEEQRMRFICGIDVVEEFEKPYREKAGNIKNLSAHLKSFIKDERGN